MTSTSRMILYAQADQIAYVRLKTVPGGSTPLDATGMQFRFVVRDKAGNLVSAKTTGSGAITIVDGLEDDLVTPTGGNNDMLAVAFTPSDLDVPPGTEYEGAAWRTDVNSTAPYWEGPITMKRAAAR